MKHRIITNSIEKNIGLSGLYLFALCLWLSSSIAYVGLGLIICSFCFRIPSNWSRIKSDAVVLLFFLFLVFLAIQTFWLRVNQTSDFGFKQAWDWISLWLFFTVAWCMRGEEKHIFNCLILVIIGFFFRLVHDVFFEIGWKHFIILLHSRRYGFQFSVNEAGHFSAVILFGFLMFLPRLLRDINNRTHFLLTTIFCIAGLGLSLEIFLLSSSRTAWLAFVITSITLLPWIYFIGRDRVNLFRLIGKKTPWVIIASVLVTILFFINIGVIKGRLRRPITQDVKTIKNLLNLDLKNIPFQNWDNRRVKSPIARRLILVYYGSLLLAERPWLGYGIQLDLPKLISAKSGNKKISKRNHLHNGFLIVLIRFGLVGGSIIFLAGLCLLYGLIQAYRSKKISKDLFLFLLGAMLITAITGLTSFRWTHRDFRFFWLLLAGMSYTRYMFVR